MFDQKTTAFRRKISDDFVLALRKPEGLAIVLLTRFVIRKEYASCSLLYQSVSDGRFDCVLDIWRHEDDDCVELTQSLQPVLDLRRKYWRIEQLPALFENNDGGRAIELHLDTVEEVEQNWGE